MAQHIDRKHVGKGTAKQTLQRLINIGKINKFQRKVGFANRNFITINGQDFMYNSNAPISDKLFKFVVKNISYEPDDDIFKRIRLNQKTRVIQKFLKKKHVAIKEKKLKLLTKLLII